MPRDAFGDTPENQPSQGAVAPHCKGDKIDISRHVQRRGRRRQAICRTRRASGAQAFGSQAFSHPIEIGQGRGPSLLAAIFDCAGPQQWQSRPEANWLRRSE